MFDFLKRKELARIKELEQTLERYRENDRNQHKEIKRLEKVELKYKILEQYVNDDEAILELLDCHKEKRKYEKADSSGYMADIARKQMEGMRNIGMIGGAMGGCLSNFYNPFD